jgi:hypothetical protein
LGGAPKEPLAFFAAVFLWLARHARENIPLPEVWCKERVLLKFSQLFFEWVKVKVKNNYKIWEAHLLIKFPSVAPVYAMVKYMHYK